MELYWNYFFNYIQNREADDLDERKLIGNGQYKIFTLKMKNT